MHKKIVIQRRSTVRLYGVKAAAAVLGVTPQAVSNFARGRYDCALRPEYRKRIKIVDIP